MISPEEWKLNLVAKDDMRYVIKRITRNLSKLGDIIQNWFKRPFVIDKQLR